ncbi:MAG: hypothetical protein QOE41_3351, partial [Mycobacterium sp.]|nr:hypothetical protein [Mycobacterium sp.]
NGGTILRGVTQGSKRNSGRVRIEYSEFENRVDREIKFAVIYLPLSTLVPAKTSHNIGFTACRANMPCTFVEQHARKAARRDGRQPTAVKHVRRTTGVPSREGFAADQSLSGRAAPRAPVEGLGLVRVRSRERAGSPAISLLNRGSAAAVSEFADPATSGSRDRLTHRLTSRHRTPAAYGATCSAPLTPECAPSLLGLLKSSLILLGLGQYRWAIDAPSRKPASQPQKVSGGSRIGSYVND